MRFNTFLDGLGGRARKSQRMRHAERDFISYEHRVSAVLLPL
jgi:hypothetical protein